MYIEQIIGLSLFAGLPSVSLGVRALNVQGASQPSNLPNVIREKNVTLKDRQQSIRANLRRSLGSGLALQLLVESICICF